MNKFTLHNAVLATVQNTNNFNMHRIKVRESANRIMGSEGPQEDQVWQKLLLRFVKAEFIFSMYCETMNRLCISLLCSFINVLLDSKC